MLAFVSINEFILVRWDNIILWCSALGDFSIPFVFTHFSRNDKAVLRHMGSFATLQDNTSIMTFRLHVVRSRDTQTIYIVMSSVAKTSQPYKLRLFLIEMHCTR